MKRLPSATQVILLLGLVTLFGGSTTDAWNGVAGDYWYRPFEQPGNYLMEFRWSLSTTGSNTYLNGEFHHTVPEGEYVSIGTLSDKDMDGLMIVCVARPSTATTTCKDYIGSGFDIDPMRVSRTTKTGESYNASTGVHTITFSRIVIENGNDLGVAALGQSKRTIWAYGPMEDEGSEPGEHPGKGIAGASIDFRSGKVIIKPKESVYTIVGITWIFTVTVAIFLRVFECAGLQVHHKVRFAAGLLIPLCYFALFCFLVWRAHTDYVEASALGPFVRALGDGALFVFNGLLLTVSRRFFFSEFFGVSHERAIKYHLVLGVLLLILVVWHLIGMQDMYMSAFILSWDTRSMVPVLPGLLAMICFCFCILFGFLRFEVSYQLFRLTHFAWIPSIVFTCLHVPNRAWMALLPGMFFLNINFIYGRIVNCSAKVVHAEFDAPSRTLIVEVTRTFMGCISPTSCHSSTRNTIGVTPAQWFYLAFPEISVWQYHPFSIARSDVITDPATGKTVQKLKFAVKETNGLGGGGGLIRTGLYKLYGLAGITEKINQFKESQSWTTALCRHADKLQGPDSKVIQAQVPISIEGPFGSVQLPLTSYRNIFLVSGGIGVTPNLLILQHLAVMAQAGERRWDNIVFVWINRDDAMLKLFAKDILEFSSMLTTSGVRVSLRLFVTRATEPSATLASISPDDKLGIVRGRRPDFDEELNLLSSRAKGSKSPTTALYSCGPVPMIHSATDAANRAPGACGMKVHVHSEVFDV